KIEGLATSGAGVGQSKIAVATFRGLSLLDLASEEERVVPFGGGQLPRALTIASDEVVLVGSDRVERRRALDGSLIDEIPILSAGLSVSAESPSRAVVGAAGAIYTITLETEASQPEPLGRLREARFFEEVAVGGSVLHLVEEETIVSRVLQSQSVSATSRSVVYAGDLVGVAATSYGACALDSRGIVICTGGQGETVATGEVSALDDASFLSIHSANDAVLVSLLEGCFGTGCRKRTVVMTPQSGTLVTGSEIEGEIVALSQSGERLAVLTDLPGEIRLYDMSSSTSNPSLVASRAIEEDAYAIALDAERNAIYAIGERVIVFSIPSLDVVGELLEPFDPTLGLPAVDQRIVVHGDRAVLTGRSSSVLVYRIDGPAEWTPVETIDLPGVVRELSRDGSLLVGLTEYSIELLDFGPPPDRRRAIRR
ncbi:MAG: hypothetical protein R3338_13070, partial [Thermoanaerobaculia bacterium]|nr:hypothetical protein [Thermoanaerobaculia bacterium]